MCQATGLFPDLCGIVGEYDTLMITLREEPGLLLKPTADHGEVIITRFAPTEIFYGARTESHECLPDTGRCWLHLRVVNMSHGNMHIGVKLQDTTPSSFAFNPDGQCCRKFCRAGLTSPDYRLGGVQQFFVLPVGRAVCCWCVPSQLPLLIML